MFQVSFDSPRLHQKHGLVAPEPPVARGNLLSLISTTLLLRRVVATSNMGKESRPGPHSYDGIVLNRIKVDCIQHCEPEWQPKLELVFLGC